MSIRLLTLRTLSPLHCGIGQGVGGIDLPIARERPTGLPIVPGSSLKGVLRSSAGASKECVAAFGPDTENASDHAGAVQFSDLNLVFLPMRSLRGTFAYITSPYALQRLRRDAGEAGVELSPLPAPPATAESILVVGEKLQVNGRVVLEDLDFKAQQGQGLGELSRQLGALFFDSAEEQAFFAQRVAVVDDDVMGMVCRLGTEVTERNRLDPDTHTVQRGALWSEEALPVESLMAGLLVETPVKRNERLAPGALLAFVGTLLGKPLQLGGKASVGRGLCRLKMAGPAGKGA